MNNANSQLPSSTWIDRFSGIQRLYGIENSETLRQSHVCIIGIGGVGTWVAEAVARNGVSHITMVDLDEICINNTNRQLHSLDGEVGKAKVDSMKERIKKINPDCQVNAVQNFFTQKSSDEILAMNFDCVIDAIDSLKHKCLLLYLCRRRKIPIISVGGAGGRLDPTRIQVKDLSRTYDDPLLAKVRKSLRYEFNFPKNPKRKFNIPTVFSDEEVNYPQADGSVCTNKGDNPEGLHLDCQSGYGTCTSVTGTFGFYAAAEAMKLILKKAKQ